MSAYKTSFFDATKSRRTFYNLSDQSPPISDDRILLIVNHAIKHCPSAFNVQSARCVILLGDQHKKLWDLAGPIIKPTVPEQAWTHLEPRIAGFKAAYGSVLFFEDQESLMKLQQANAMIAHVIPEWSDHSSGMHQFIVWTALEAEGFGCNLQHYNFHPEFTEQVIGTWKLPATWKLKAQLNFGTPKSPPGERTYEPVEDRVKVFK